ncbi:extracellular calcium-sensing receptor-like [Rhopilema esculentum]|uniref:extracellular calcium-sensing receptor-like n=2 Tax=Rhopilema esculentum TaxID=499914 RepID=UPI0031DAFFD3|eukprot:gene8626-14638_t
MFEAAGLIFLTSFIFTQWHSGSYVESAFCNNSLFVSQTNGQNRRTIIQDGDFMLQGIFSQTKGPDCGTMSREGVVNVVVMQLAIEHISRSNILPGFKLGYQIDDGCTDIPKVMKRGIEIVSMYRPNSVCRADFIDCKSNKTGQGVKSINAVVGPGYSFLTIPLASLMGLYNIPHISYQASSRLLNKRELYKSFFRTIPSDSNQVLVMLDMMKKFGWNYLVAIGSDDDYGKLGISALKEAAASRNVCIAYDAYVPNTKDKMRPKVDEIVSQLKALPKAKLVILFTYTSMGEMILQEAEKNNIHRVWLTSDAWSATGPSLNVSEQCLSGIMTVATEKVKIPTLERYLESKISNEAECNPWLALYLKQQYNCHFINQVASCPGQTPSSISEEMLADNSGGYGNLYDAVFAVSHSIQAMLTKKCGYQTSSYNNTICFPFSPKELLAEIPRVNFTGIFSRSVAFDGQGDPKEPHYIIENIQKINGRLQYVQIGTWDMLSAKQRGTLNLNTEKIIWPKGFVDSRDSKCSRDCLPGEYVNAKTECCWSCQDCPALHVSSKNNSRSCIKCPARYHTDSKRTVCIKTPIIYLTPSSGGGVAILTVSFFGIFIDFVIMGLFYKIRHSVLVKESQPAIIVFSISVLLFSFLYGVMHILKPNNDFCSGRSSYFFMLFATFAGMLLASTTIVKETITAKINKHVTIDAFVVQYFVIIFVMLIELVAIIVWLSVDPVEADLFPRLGNTELFLECKLELTLSRLICIALPCVVLIISMIIAFRERDQEHLFNEPKFLSFTTIAISIIVVAFIPTFKYVVGVYKAMVMAFTVDLCAYTYIGCMFVPKIYTLMTNGYNLGCGHSENGVAGNESCSVHGIEMREGKKSVTNTDFNASLEAQDKVSDQSSEVPRPENSSNLSSPVSQKSLASPRKLSDTGSGSHLMPQKPTYV